MTAIAFAGPALAIRRKYRSRPSAGAHEGQHRDHEPGRRRRHRGRPGEGRRNRQDDRRRRAGCRRRPPAAARRRGGAWPRSARRRSRPSPTRQARTASGVPPACSPALSQATIQTTPAKPIAQAGDARPASAGRRARARPMTAANTVVGRVEDREHARVHRDRRVGEAEEGQGRVRQAERRRSAASGGAGRQLAACREQRQEQERRAGDAQRRRAPSGPNSGTAMRMKRNEPPQSAARATSSARSRGLNAAPAASRAWRRPRAGARLETEQRGLAVEAAGVAGQGAVAADDAVAGHDDRDRVAADGGADRAPRGRRAEPPRRCRRSCRCAPGAMRQQLAPDAAAGTACRCRSSGRSKAVAAPSK